MDLTKLTPQQQESIDFAKTKNYEPVKTETLMGENCVKIENKKTGDFIFIFPDGNDVQGLSIAQNIAGFWKDPLGVKHAPNKIATYESLYVKMFETFIKKTEDKISVEQFKNIPIDREVVYQGTTYDVFQNNGYVLKLINKDKTKVISVNYKMFNDKGAIRS